MNPTDKAFPVTWDQFHRDARALAWRISGMGVEWRACVCITRGGLVPTAIICRELGIRMIETLAIASYHDYDAQGALQVIKSVSEDIRRDGGKDVLVVDDLTDTGKTARAAREILPDAHYAAVYAKPEGKPLVDSFVTEVSQDTWIYFPWDLGVSYQQPIAQHTRG